MFNYRLFVPAEPGYVAPLAEVYPPKAALDVTSGLVPDLCTPGFARGFLLEWYWIRVGASCPACETRVCGAVFGSVSVVKHLTASLGSGTSPASIRSGGGRDSDRGRIRVSDSTQRPRQRRRQRQRDSDRYSDSAEQRRRQKVTAAGAGTGRSGTSTVTALMPSWTSRSRRGVGSTSAVQQPPGHRADLVEKTQRFVGSNGVDCARFHEQLQVGVGLFR